MRSRSIRRRGRPRRPLRRGDARSRRAVRRPEARRCRDLRARPRRCASFLGAARDRARLRRRGRRRTTAGIWSWSSRSRSTFRTVEEMSDTRPQLGGTTAVGRVGEDTRRRRGSVWEHRLRSPGDRPAAGKRRRSLECYSSVCRLSSIISKSLTCGR